MTRNSWRSAPQERPVNEGALHATSASDWRAARRHDDPNASTSASSCWRGGGSSKRNCGHDSKRQNDHHTAPPRSTKRPPRPSQRKPRPTLDAAAAPLTQQEPQQPWHAAQATGVAASVGTTSDTASAYSCYSRYNASSGGSSHASSGSTRWADMAEEDAAMEQAGLGLDLGELEAEHGWFKQMMAEHRAEVEAAQAAAEQAPRASRRGKAAKKAVRRAAEAAAAAQPAASNSSSSCPAVRETGEQQREEPAVGCGGGRLSPVISSDCDCAVAEAAEVPAAGARGASGGSTCRGLHGGAYIRSLSLMSSCSGESWSSEALDEEFEALEAYCVAPDAEAKAAAFAKAGAAAKAAAVATVKPWPRPG